MFQCDYFDQKKCQSCFYTQNPYQESVNFKQQKIENAFKKFGSPIILNFEQASDAFHWRNKAKWAVGGTNGDLQFGIYGRDQAFTPVDWCSLHEKSVNEFGQYVLDCLNIHQVSSYDLKSKKGDLKYVLVTSANQGEELLLRFILSSKSNIHKFKLISHDLKKTFPNLKVVSCNIQPIHAAILEGEEEFVLTDERMITHQFGEIRLQQTVKSFFQVNSLMASKLYHTGKAWLESTNTRVVLDLFCGAGGFGQIIGQGLEKLIGVELSSDAIETAKSSAILNQLTHAEYVACDAFEFLKSSKNQFDTIIVNPPRRGLGKEVCDKILETPSTYLLYSSCHLDTLSSDLEFLTSKYVVRRVQGFDMFPWSDHFEVLTLLELQTNS